MQSKSTDWISRLRSMVRPFGLHRSFRALGAISLLEGAALKDLEVVQCGEQAGREVGHGVEPVHEALEFCHGGRFRCHGRGTQGRCALTYRNLPAAGVAIA